MSKTEAMSKTIVELQDELGDAEAELVRYSTALEGYRTFEESGVEAVKRMRAELAAANQRIEELEGAYNEQKEATHYWDERTRRILLEIGDYPSMADAIDTIIEKKAEMEAQLAAANQRIAETETVFGEFGEINGKCKDCGSPVALVTGSTNWSVDEEAFDSNDDVSDALKRQAADARHDGVEIGGEMSGHFCLQCQKLTSLYRHSF